MGKYDNRLYVDGVITTPSYPKSLAKKYTRPDNKVYFREDLNGPVEFLRGDFNKIWAQELEHEFTISIDRKNGSLYENYINGVSHKTDGTFDEDTKNVLLNINSIDKYKKLLDAADKEFDLVKDLAPPIYEVNYKKQPLLQIVFPYHNVLFNQVGDTTFLTDLGTNYTEAELEDFGFATTGERYLYVPGGSEITPNVGGLYEEISSRVYERTDGQYRIKESSGPSNNWVIVEAPFTGTDNIVFVATYGDVDNPFETKSPFDPDPIFEDFDNPLDTFYCAAFPVLMYQRLLTDATTVSGNATIALPVPDIGDLELLYSNYVDPDDYPNLFAYFNVSDNHTTTPTAFGRYSPTALHFADEYFNPDLLLPPSNSTRAYPLMQTSWTEYSIAVYSNAFQQGVKINSATDELLRNGYKLGDVIKYLLNAIDPTLTFDSLAAYSSFLFSTTNPITTETNFTHFITPKSNIVIGDYDSPATRGPITFNQIEELLENALNCAWHIDAAGMFHIEHIKFYKNGKSYLAPIVSNDLTVQANPMNNKFWAFGTKKYSYEKEAMPEQYDFSWMDEVSDVFKGYPIKMLSTFVDKGNRTEKIISAFTTDLDYMQAAIENISKDGFCILATTFADDEYTVQNTILSATGTPDILVQNGFWSFTYLHDLFHRHNLPCRSVNLNNNDITATTVKRSKKQDITYPAPLEPDPMRLITTSIGTGEIKSMEINMTTRECRMTVLHDLDFDNPCPTC